MGSINRANVEDFVMNPTCLKATLLGAVLGLTVPALAQDNMPPTQTSHGITFVTGGVGELKEQAFKSAAKDYNLRATFTAPGGAYMANVNVTLKNDKGNTLVATESQGPFFYAQVPPGRYDLTAAYGDQRVERPLEVGKQGAATIDMVFKVPVGKP